RLPQATTLDADVLEVTSPVLLVGAFSDGGGITLQDEAAALDGALDGNLVSLGDGGFRASVGEIEVVPTFGRVPAGRVTIVGLGPKGDTGPSQLRRASAAASRRLADHQEIASLLHLVGDDGAASSRAVTEGLLLGTYRYTAMKSDPRPSKIQRIVLVGADDGVVARGVAAAEAVFLARDLINEPASTLTPAALARRAEEVADVAGLGCEIWDEKALEDLGCGGILGVGRGSVEPPRLIKLTYRPDGATDKVALVGKGITYDTGGYSLKPSASMEQMKTDMAGGAAVIAAMSALRRLDIDVEVVGFIPCSENMVSGASIKPGDVITLYGGKTVEVNNTDAEGRLVLADALGLACAEEPSAVIDIATLTGSIHIALGPRVSGLFANEDGLARELVEASERAGEEMWRMPIVDAYRKEIDSSTADMRNSGSRYGSAIIATLFLKEFVAPQIPWVHLDIAGTGRTDSDHDEKSKGGTAVGVRTLLTWLEDR
ncbi:MAG: leucyl aminopeptidase, partial [Actinomycetota bacterium]